MKQLEGFKVLECTEDRIVQERIFEDGVKVTVVGNPNPDPVERQKMVDEIGCFILECARRHEAEKNFKSKQDEKNCEA